MSPEDKKTELQRLRARVSELEVELTAGGRSTPWSPKGYYTTYHILAGMVLGLIAAAASLLLNIIGSSMVHGDPLLLIKIYLTFPLGAKALEAASGFALAAGCFLYLGTGMIGGIPFHLILSRFFDNSKTSVRFAIASVLGIGVWLVNFYGILIWLQPLLIHGNWIVEQIPWYVAAFTHMVFGWTMLLVDQWGKFVPRQHQAPVGEAT